MPAASIHLTREGWALLNVGCGGCFSTEWNNLDRLTRRGVHYHDLRQPLPYADNSFDAVYSSHVLEHFNPAQGEELVREFFRVLKPNGIVRVVVPDLERICREYLKQLDAAWSDPASPYVDRYRWMQLELMDQMTRDVSGGMMRQMLNSGEFDRDFVVERMGAELVGPAAIAGGKRDKKQPAAKYSRLSWRRIRQTLKMGTTNPQQTGEVHKWMYDRLSLRLLLEKTGFGQFSVKTAGTSEIPGWSRYALDSAPGIAAPRKPDSIFVEAIKPALK